MDYNPPHNGEGSNKRKFAPEGDDNGPEDKRPRIGPAPQTSQSAAETPSLLSRPSANLSSDLQTINLTSQIGSEARPWNGSSHSIQHPIAHNPTGGPAMPWQVQMQQQLQRGRRQREGNPQEAVGLARLPPAVPTQFAPATNSPYGPRGPNPSWVGWAPTPYSGAQDVIMVDEQPIPQESRPEQPPSNAASPGQGADHGAVQTQGEGRGAAPPPDALNQGVGRGRGRGDGASPRGGRGRAGRGRGRRGRGNIPRGCGDLPSESRFQDDPDPRLDCDDHPRREGESMEEAQDRIHGARTALGIMTKPFPPQAQLGPDDHWPGLELLTKAEKLHQDRQLKADAKMNSRSGDVRRGQRNMVERAHMKRLKSDPTYAQHWAASRAQRHAHNKAIDDERRGRLREWQRRHDLPREPSPTSSISSGDGFYNQEFQQAPKDEIHQRCNLCHSMKKPCSLIRHPDVIPCDICRSMNEHCFPLVSGVVVRGAPSAAGAPYRKRVLENDNPDREIRRGRPKAPPRTYRKVTGLQPSQQPRRMRDPGPQVSGPHGNEVGTLHLTGSSRQPPAPANPWYQQPTQAGPSRQQGSQLAASPSRGFISDEDWVINGATPRAPPENQKYSRRPPTSAQVSRGPSGHHLPSPHGENGPACSICLDMEEGRLCNRGRPCSKCQERNIAPACKYSDVPSQASPSRPPHAPGDPSGGRGNRQGGNADHPGPSSPLEAENDVFGEAMDIAGNVESPPGPDDGPNDQQHGGWMSFQARNSEMQADAVHPPQGLPHMVAHEDVDSGQNSIPSPSQTLDQGSETFQRRPEAEFLGFQFPRWAIEAVPGDPNSKKACLEDMTFFQNLGQQPPQQGSQMCGKKPAWDCQFLGFHYNTVGQETDGESCAECKGGHRAAWAAEWKDQFISESKAYLCQTCATTNADVYNAISTVKWKSHCLCVNMMENVWLCNEHLKEGWEHVFVVLMRAQVWINKHIEEKGTDEDFCVGCFEGSAEPEHEKAMWLCKFPLRKPFSISTEFLDIKDGTCDLRREDP
ncbi:hypothetical protein BJ875DRAFT_545864 [Amylocarpus encephaloides]|uniref:Uncharacterized protein n=1 Tax=Amylocarpus encephaloides TaxID=45428 RepID=A0A9P7YBT5_9HELO|nr:hypothetical protein BJ875DRAFT_545864 [Amylocarpus encephaloides]